MPHQTLKLVPGVDENRTPALNEAAISYSNLIRFIPDKQSIGLPQKLGGWTRYYPNALAATPRALLAWADTNSNNYLAVGCDTSATSGVGAPLYVIKSGTQNTITPQVSTANPAVSVTTLTSTNSVTINQTSSNITSYNSVFIATHISVGGIILFGLYQTYGLSSSSYTVYSVDVLGFPATPTSAVTNGGAVASFATTSSSSLITVTLNNHGYTVGSSYPILVSTTVGGVTLYGNYTVTSVTTNTFTILAQNAATSSTSASINGGNAKYIYYYGYGSLSTGSGYGIGDYGSGGYGTGTAPVASVGTNITATDWALDNWGEILIACPYGVGTGTNTGSVSGGPIYTWAPGSNPPVATVIPQAPSANNGIFVAMPQRQIIAWGSTFNGIQDPLMLRWCDVGNYTSWIGQITNQAGYYRIPKGSQIVGCIQGPQQGLVWTDLAVWAMQYVGQPYIYQFNEIGNGCGLIAPKAAASLNGVVYWMGQSQFFNMTPNGVQPIFCPVWDVIFQELDTANVSKIRVAPNSRFGEISWFIPTTSSGGEVGMYAKLNVVTNQWDYGTLTRTAWINQSVLGPPIGGSSNGLVYQHETSNDADGSAMNSSFQTGYFVLGDGDVMTYIDQFWPDAKWGFFGGTPSATLQITFYVVNYPGDTPTAYGPFSVTQATEYITPRFRGRLVSIKVESTDVGSFWRLGAMRYRYQPDGKF